MQCSMQDMRAAKIKELLPHTWVPFFSRFGRFLPIQELTIPRILKGKNVVVISPSASGKTEAVIAPIIENSLSKLGSPDQKGMRILYVSPTRALVNDLFRRLSDPVTYTGLTIGRKTGDLPQPNIANMPSVLITTPESFDSLLTRHPKTFLTLGRVILDEIHLLDNTPRGDQLRVLLNRLRRINDKLQYCALSATIDDVDIGRRYFDDPEICMLKRPREIENEYVPSQKFISMFFERVHAHGFKKILVFFNARSFVETFSQELNRPPFHDHVYVHHASLEKQRRESVEQQMIHSEHAILCATSTLELGIDIGDIDCIVLYRPPFNISSLLQRIGRGNRRTDELFSISVYTNMWERLLFETYFKNAREGMLFDKRYQPSLSVVPQQIYSYLYQRRRIGTTLKSVCRIMAPIYTTQQVRSIFKGLIELGYIKEVRPSIFYNAPAMEDKIRYGKIHSNIAEVSFGEYDVINTGNDQRIGRVFHLKQRFMLGGKCWDTVRVDNTNKSIYVKFIGNAPAVAKVFEGKGGGNYAYALSSKLKQRLFPDLTEMEFPYACEQKCIYLLHVLGNLYGSILTDSLDHEGYDALDIDGKVLVLQSYTMKNNRFPRPAGDSIRQILGKDIARFEDALGSGAYIYDLPREYQIEDHYLNLDIDGFLEYLGSIKLKEVNITEFRERIQKLK